MAEFPEYLYTLTSRDQQVTPLEIVNHNFGQGTTTGNVSTTPASGNYMVPKGRTLIINNVTLFARAFATGQTMYGVMRYDAGGTNIFYGPSGAPINQLTTGTDMYFPANNLPVYVPEGYILSLQFYFSVAGASSVFGGSFSGILIPRGNIAI